MGLKLNITPRAAGDLEEIRNYLFQHSPQGADRVRASIWNVMQRLCDMPQSGSRTDEADVRVAQLVRYPYRIFYVVRADAVDIVHVRHTSRRPFTPSDI